MTKTSSASLTIFYTISDITNLCTVHQNSMGLSHLSPVEHVIQNLITSISLVCARGPIAIYINYSYALLIEILQLLFGPWLNPSFWGNIMHKLTYYWRYYAVFGSCSFALENYPTLCRYRRGK